MANNPRNNRNNTYRTSDLLDYLGEHDAVGQAMNQLESEMLELASTDADLYTEFREYLDGLDGLDLNNNDIEKE